jgi:hypothetical protein
MPRVELITPNAVCFTICTRQTETLLRAWFDEVLPYAYVTGRPGIDDFDVIWPRVRVWPIWAWKLGTPSDPDWLTDTRVLGRLIDLEAKDGDSGLRRLLEIRQRLETELKTFTVR